MSNIGDLIAAVAARDLLRRPRAMLSANHTALAAQSGVATRARPAFAMTGVNRRDRTLLIRRISSDNPRHCH